jgi:predicted nucleic acid-binding Zn ribbon protein
MRRVKRIEVLYFLSFFFLVKFTLLFSSRLAVDDVEIAATAFFILDKSTTEKKRRRNYSSFSFFLVYSLRVVNMHLSKRDHPICDFHFYFGEKKGIEQKTVYTHTNRKKEKPT